MSPGQWRKLSLSVDLERGARCAIRDTVAFGDPNGSECAVSTQLFADVVAFETICGFCRFRLESAGTVRGLGACGARSKPRQYRTEI